MASRRTVRAEGDPIPTHETLALGESEYLEETNEVRHVVARNGSGPVEWATEPFLQYASRECAKAGSGAVLSAIEGRLGSEVEHIAASARVGSEGDADMNTETNVLVTYRVWVDDWNGTVTSAPTVDFEELVAVTPSTVKATVELGGREDAGGGREYSCEVPVFVRKTEAQLL